MTGSIRYATFDSNQIAPAFVALNRNMDHAAVLSQHPGGYALHFGEIGQSMPHILPYSVDPLPPNGWNIHANSRWSILPTTPEHTSLMLRPSVVHPPTASGSNTGSLQHLIWAHPNDFRFEYAQDGSLLVTKLTARLTRPVLSDIQKAAAKLLANLARAQEMNFPDRFLQDSLRAFQSGTRPDKLYVSSDGVPTSPVARTCLLRLIQLSQAYDACEYRHLDDPYRQFHIELYHAAERLLASAGIPIPALPAYYLPRI